MSTAADLDSPLDWAANDLLSQSRSYDGSPDPVGVWASPEKARRWLGEIRQACIDPPPHAAKAAEWLLDNDYQIYRALRRIEKDLPADFYNQLPAETQVEVNLPRIYSLASCYLAATHMQFSLAGLVRFVDVYQQRAPLKIAELWALPTILRIFCIEVLVLAFEELLHEVASFEVSALLRESQTRAIDPTELVARSISNLGIIASISWKDFFDRVCLVEGILARDPSQDYASMDFETRNRYRGAVEQIARHSNSDERDVAQAAIRCARSCGPSEVRRHVGFWLVDQGRAELERDLGAKLPLGDRVRRFVLEHPAQIYALAILSTGIGVLILPAIYLAIVGASLTGWIAAMLASTVPASVLAITAVHWAITRLLPPSVLPKLDCEKALPPDCKTFVVVPVVIGKVDEVDSLVQQLETHWLANLDPNLQVALLADLADAQTEAKEGDIEITDALAKRIEALNARHRRKALLGPFHLLMRPRLFNPGEGCWMAWERKRGKLEQFNRLLVEGDWAAFSLHVGDRAAMQDIAFVVTVDADTMLPPGSVKRLVGTITHPLNRPRLDIASGRVTRGYSLVQPRVEISPKAGNRSLFARLFTGDTAIDIYSRAVSDVYQDLFGTGIFVGKGIYDVRAFHASVDGRVPENRILSHDLFEGAHGRAALATDIVLYEDFPASYPEYARRLHRWIRGDWQLLEWLLPRVPGPEGVRFRNPMTLIDRWKILDNLRRSLVAPGLLLLALAGWFFLPGSPWFWTALVVMAPCWQLFTDIISGLARGRRVGVSYGLLDGLKNQAGRWLQLMVYLLHEALLSLHAIGITLWRNLVSHRHLLEWTSAAHVATRVTQRSRRAAVWREMWVGPIIALAIAIFLFVYRPGALPPAVPLLVVWLVAPEIALFSGRPRQSRTIRLDNDDIRYLRLLARRTWYYFEAFAGPEDNWLPPDNYQGPPFEEIAHRTSPTNIGMLLLSTAASWDMGFLGRSELAARGGNVFEALRRLERYRGHFYNWYETRHLRPLEPRYVSTVDSGNLAVCLIAFAETLREAAADLAIEPQRWEGVHDLLSLIEETTFALPQADAFHDLIRAFAERVATISKSGRERWASSVKELRDVNLPKLEAAAISLASAIGEDLPERMQDLPVWLNRLRHQLDEMLRDLAPAGELDMRLRELADDAVALAWSMEFAWLYDGDRRLFFIGYNVTASRMDTHHYDLLASEARLASFFAIAKGDVPIEHWFHLGRPVTRTPGGISLLSWNGSMFEYLMPRLLLKGEAETLLGESERAAVEIQRRYGARHSIPWGVSESAYSDRDPAHRYRYQAFGTPGLGLKRGLSRDRVVAPYASALALAIEPHEACANLRKLTEMGAEERYGMWESLDFTPERAPSNRPFVPVIAYMAHHQGMILCAIANVLTEDRMVARFQRDPQVQLVSLLLSERVPQEVPPEIDRLEAPQPVEDIAHQSEIVPWNPAPTPFPQVHVMGNGRLSCWIAESGGGVLRWQGQAITRFVPDAVRDADGMWLYIHDLESDKLWSATRQPTDAIPDQYQVLFQPHVVEIHRRDAGIDTRLDVYVGKGEDIEVRRLSLINESNRPRSLRLTSYAEVVLAPPLEDERHPAFSKLFVGGTSVPQIGGLQFTRSPRRPNEAPAAMVQYAIDESGPIADLRCEVDRRTFIGRGRDLRNPSGAKRTLNGSTGWTLDPVSALQCDVIMQPGERRTFCFVTAVAASPAIALKIARRHATLASMEWIFGDAAIEAAHTIARAKVRPEDLPAIQSLGSLMIQPHGALRARADRIRQNRLGQGGLWGLALSGDLPILLLRIGAQSDRLLELLAGAVSIWRYSGLTVDLVILQSSGSTYSEPLRTDLHEFLREIGASDMLGRSGGIHLVFADQIGADQVVMLDAMAWVVLDDDGRLLAEQLDRALEQPALSPPIVPTHPEESAPAPAPEWPEKLDWFNGIGGFCGKVPEYVIRLRAGETTPAPWVNILANEDFGTLVTEAGGGFTWSINSGENRITPWTNDPVSDRPVEAIFLRDEETVAVWSVTPSPVGRDADVEIRHGHGYTEWHRLSHGIAQEQWVCVAPNQPVKIVGLKLRNTTDRPRRLTATYYAEWLLGSLPSIARRHVTCRFDSADQTILATSPWNVDFAGHAAFLTSTWDAHSFTCDRQEFLGREADLAKPAALQRWGLSNSEAIGVDACGAYQVHINLSPGDETELSFVLGAARSEAEAIALAQEWRSGDRVARVREVVAQTWEERIGCIQVETPDPAFDEMVNHWLIYQSLSSRVLARAGFYQASGAIGFRDQLQDMLALLLSDPRRARAHILDCAAHQFEEGDVLHWWHPPKGRGVRTRFSDDLLWLPYATGVYVRATGDLTILDEVIPFLSAPPLGEDEHDRYSQFVSHEPGASLIEHCERALERIELGAHGLPLMGTGDWNDGMDRVGDRGRGESVWLGWFASVTAGHLADVERRMGRVREAAHWQQSAQVWRTNAEYAGWDGGWYRRAYDDEGHALGTAKDSECRIDSISQSWAVFAGADPQRSALALEAAFDELVDADAHLARLLWPPFEGTARDPGYIKAYPPGLRENGGQYAHAAAWLGLALAQTGRPDDALRIFHMICPANRTASKHGADHYRIEPYVVAGDIAAAEPHRGKGGWSWYTGAAAWTWRLAVEGLLGISLEDGEIRIAPSLPTNWPGFKARVRRGNSTIAIELTRARGVSEDRITVDGADIDGARIAFPPDGETREVHVMCGASAGEEIGASS